MEVNNLLRWFARQSKEVQLEIMSQDDILKLARKIKSVKDKIQINAVKRLDRDLEPLTDSDKLRVAAIKKPRGGWHISRPSVKEERIKKFLELILKLRREKNGWLIISRYLEKYHSFKVTPAYLQRVCKKYGVN